MRTPTSAQRRLYRKIAFGGFALSVLILAVALFVDPALVFGSIGVLAITGTAYTEGRIERQGDAVHIKPSVEQALTRIRPSRFPFTQFLMRMSRGEKAKTIIHNWGELSDLDRSDTVNGATIAGGAGASVTVTVDNGAMWRADDTFISLTNATDTSALNVYYISAVSGNDLTVYVLPQSTSATPYAADAFGTVPAFADAEVFYWTGNMKSQNFTGSASRILQPAYNFNFVQAFDAKILWADHKNYQENFGPKDVRRYRRDNLYEFRKNLEYSALFNRNPAVVTDPNTSELSYLMGGAMHFAGANSITLSTTGGVPSESQGVDFIYACFQDNNGSGTKLILGGADFMKAVDKINTSDLQTKRSERVAGVQIIRMEGRIGRLLTAYHPGFDETGRVDEALVLDMAHIKLTPYAPMERRVLNLKRSGQGQDADGEYWTVKHTLTMMHPDTHKHATLVIS